MTDSNAHFRSVLRGYDPAQVDQHVHELAQAAAAARQEAAQRTVENSKLEATQGQLRKEVERHVQRARTLEEEQMKASAPTYATLGERIGSMLTLADKEANELRERAKADAANHHALADESALATRQDAEHYATETRSAAKAEAARFMEDAKRQADSVLDDADRQAMARREEAEAVYERSRAKSATAAVDFETTLAARRDSSALEFAAEVSAAEQQLATVRTQSEQARIESEQSQQEAATRSEQQLEQATSHARTLVAEAKSKAERIRGDSERELAAATQRRDSINAQLSNVRQMLAALGGAAAGSALDLVAPVDGQAKTAAPAGTATQAAPADGQAKTAAPAATAAAPAAEKEKTATNVQGGKDPKQSGEVAGDKVKDAEPKNEKVNDKKADSGQNVGAKR
ncbi:MAG: DivIVA domain-containing protein [Actinomycetota bacterium]